MAPNWIIENGGDAHHAFTFSTTLAGSITNLSANFTLLPYSATGSYDNKPFTGFTDLAVTSGTTYWYQVSAFSTAGESARSAEQSVTPQPQRRFPAQPGCSAPVSADWVC